MYIFKIYMNEYEKKVCSRFIYFIRIYVIWYYQIFYTNDTELFKNNSIMSLKIAVHMLVVQ